MQSLWMVAAAFLFSCMGVCVKLAAEAGYSPAEIVFYRNAIALLLMTSSLLWGRLDPRTPLWKFQIYRGVSGFISLMLYFYAIAWLPLATAVTLNYTSPLFLALFLAVHAIPGGWGEVTNLATAAGNKFAVFNFDFNMHQPYLFWSGLIESGADSTRRLAASARQGHELPPLSLGLIPAWLAAPQAFDARTMLLGLKPLPTLRLRHFRGPARRRLHRCLPDHCE